MNRDKKTPSILMLAGVVALLPFVSGNAFAATPNFGMLYYDGGVVQTVVPPSETKKGFDDLYVVLDEEGMQIQMAIAGVAPGDRNYHGGHWIVNEVTFNVDPYELKSEADVIEAESSGDVTVTKTMRYFLCPIQPN